MHKKHIILYILLCFVVKASQANDSILVGAAQTPRYLPLLKNKKVALVVNQTSCIGSQHLVDSLLNLGVAMTKIFAPEHGFRGEADAGEHVSDGIDAKTKLPIISLYGKNKKLRADQLNDTDVVIFDIQDVGVRFYTYISTMHYVMEACAKSNKLLIILDRPNPNGHYVDGPVLDTKFQSFVGMHPIPIVYGLTVGELAQMINGEKWLKNGMTCPLQVVPVKHYTHKTRYSLPIKPSPNLPNDRSIYLYPSLALFEGTVISVGRGTSFPFQTIGYPDKESGSFSFTPKSIAGMAKYPKHEQKTCYGVDLRTSESPPFTIKYLLDFYHRTKLNEAFFIQNNFFEKLAGNDLLRKQVLAGLDEEEIRVSWLEELEVYKKMRKKYLLYPDFE